MKPHLSQSFTQESNTSIFRSQQERPHLLKKTEYGKINEEKDLYKLIVDHQMIKSIQIIEIFKEEDHDSLFKKHIVNYVIQIKTDYFDYTIPKRYSEFEKLHDQLQSYSKHLPKFPSKTVIQTNSKKNIASRKDLLQQYLQYLLKQLDHSLYVLLDFLNIKEQFSKGGFGFNVKIHQLSKDENALSDLIDISPKKIQPKNESEQMLITYLKKLNEIPEDRGKIFQKMEKYFFGKINQISPTMLRLLYNGDEERKFEGILSLLNTPTTDTQNHISCNHGLQFLRKLLEYDYNPYADIALKIFQEISIKQFKQMCIQTHICGISKLCKQDSLIILNKYIVENQLKDQMIQYLIDNVECQQEYDTFVQSLNNKKKDDQRNNIDSSENLQEHVPTKSSSTEYAILEQEPTIEQLLEISQTQMNWKYVTECHHHIMYHLMGQFVKTFHPIKCNIQKASQLFSQQKIQWFHGMIQRDQIEELNQNTKLIVEYYIWEDMSKYKKMAFISEEEILKIDENNIQIRLIPSNQNIGDYKIKCDEQGQKMALFLLKKISENETEVTIYQNIIDKTFRTAFAPVILKEMPWFNTTIEKLLTQL